MEKRVKHGGRKKGTPNKITAAVKDALVMAFDELGGVKSLVAWGRENQTEFYKLWVKVLPQEVNANLNGSITVSHEDALNQLADDPA
jgi:hypothetical protein